MGVFTQMTTPLTRAGNALEQAEHMTRDVAEVGALRQFRLYIGIHAAHHRYRIRNRRVTAEQLAIDLRQQARILVGLASHHHAIEMLQMRFRLFQRLHAAINGDSQLGKITL